MELSENNNTVQGKQYDNSELLEKIENAYKIYKLSEVYITDVADDYGKTKIARLRLDFARHELLDLLNKAKEKGIKLSDIKIIKDCFFSL